MKFIRFVHTAYLYNPQDRWLYEPPGSNTSTMGGCRYRRYPQNIGDGDPPRSVESVGRKVARHYHLTQKSG